MSKDSEKINILVVDDLQQKRLVYEAILGDLGENVVCVGSGTEALRQLLHEEFAVILLDVNMPGMDGFETAELIRSRKKCLHIPIIFITAYADELLSARGYDHGAVDYLLSPVTPHVLRSKVKVFADLARMRREIQKRAEERVALAEEQGKRIAAEEANVAKSRFLANVSHELRTPMNGILGMLELALSEKLPAGLDEYLRTAKESAETLLTLLNELLDLSRIESGKFSLEVGPFSLRDLLHQTAKSLAVRAHEKGLELICEVPDSIPDDLAGDELRLRQVLTNLIGNAIKFTDKGEIDVQVNLGKVENERIELRFSVTDTGAGISESAREKIFEPFTQGDSSSTRRHGGTGLGLAIATSIVQLMGGRLEVESEPGVGSRFSFNVFLSETPLKAPAASRLLALSEPLHGLSVLVVDDNATNRQVLKSMLSSWSMRPLVVGDAPSAIRRLKQETMSGRKPRVALIDAVMPGQDGFSLAKQIEEDPQLSDIKLILLSSLGSHARKSCETSCIAICLEKPIFQMDLLRALAQVLGYTVETHPVPAGERDDSAIGAAAARSLTVLLAEDTPANQKLVEIVLETRGHQLIIAANGTEAIDLLEKQDFDLILMDVEMPDLNGLEATALIRSLPDPRKAKIPIVAMTAHAMKGDRERCLAAGMNAYLTKPVNRHALIRLVESLCESSMPANTTTAELGRPVSTAELTDAEPFNLNKAVNNCFGQYHLFEQMAQYLEDEIEQVRGEFEAGEQDRDPGRISKAAHRLKGTLFYLAAQPCLELATKIEKRGLAGDLENALEAIPALEQQLSLLRAALTAHRGTTKPSSEQHAS